MRAASAATHADVGDRIVASLSSPISIIKHHHPVVVIGSGYGGGIAASRMARAGQRVCVLERGREFQPGEYPNTTVSAIPEMQADLPTSFTGNGDVVRFGYNNDREINGIGFGHRSPEKMSPVGSCITGIIDMRAAPELEGGMVIEEAAIPGGVSDFLPEVFAFAATTLGKGTDRGLIDRLQEWFRMLVSWFRRSRHGAVRKTQTYLVMTHDGTR